MSAAFHLISDKEPVNLNIILTDYWMHSPLSRNFAAVGQSKELRGKWRSEFLINKKGNRKKKKTLEMYRYNLEWWLIRVHRVLQVSMIDIRLGEVSGVIQISELRTTFPPIALTICRSSKEIVPLTGCDPISDRRSSSSAAATSAPLPASRSQTHFHLRWCNFHRNGAGVTVVLTKSSFKYGIWVCLKELLSSTRRPL